MEFLGIGPLELVFIILLAIIIFGPKDIVNTSKTVGKSLNKFIRSDTWKTINQTSRELKNLPTRLMRETGLDDLEKTTKEEIASVDKVIHQSIGPAFIPDTHPGFIKTPAGPGDDDPDIETPVKGPVG
jgi:Sec-independent protein translocase protein TatA